MSRLNFIREMITSYADQKEDDGYPDMAREALLELGELDDIENKVRELEVEGEKYEALAEEYDKAVEKARGLEDYKNKVMSLNNSLAFNSELSDYDYKKLEKALQELLTEGK